MTPSNQIPAVCNYGTSAVYSDYPSPEQMRAGVVPLDSLPAAWWNKMWCASNCAINEARDMVGQIITEVNNVLCQAGINPQAACTDQLYQSINKIRQTLATASVAGAVVSSSTASEVAVDPTTGRMTVNCLGNAASLSTSASTVVGAINELKSTYDCCFSDTATALNGKAPTSHASSATTYGVGSADNYGHLKISDTYTSVLAACSGVAASQKALACVYAVAAAAAAGNVSLGNTAGCALGTAAAGTAITAARSDHVHPVPTCVPYAVTGGYLGERAALGCAPNCTYGIANIWNYCNDSRYYLIGTKYDNSACKYNVRVDYATSAGSAGSVSRATFGDCANGEHNANSIKSNGLWYYTSNGPATTLGASTNDGALYSQAYSTSWVSQIAQDYRNGNLFVRGLNNGTWSTWKAIPTKDLYGSAATKDVFTRSDVGDIGWGTAANRTKVVDVGAMAYWNGAYQGTSSNLRYYCGGAFGTAAACAATAFRSSSWYPSFVTCAERIDNVPANCSNTVCNAIFRVGCTTSTSAASIKTTCICGTNGYYYGNICGNVCGTASSAVYATSAGSATSAVDSCNARCHYYYSNCLRVFTNGSNCTGWGCMYLCNFSNVAVRLFIPSVLNVTCSALAGTMCACWPTYIDNCMKQTYFNFECGTELYCLLKNGNFTIPANAKYCFYIGCLSKVFCIPTVAYY